MNGDRGHDGVCDHVHLGSDDRRSWVKLWLRLAHGGQLLYRGVWADSRYVGDEALAKLRQNCGGSLAL